MQKTWAMVIGSSHVYLHINYSWDPADGELEI
jgi:hypothetical protein